MKPQIDVNNKSNIAVPRATVQRSSVTRRDQLTEALRLEIKRLMLHHGDMAQIELARRAGEPQQRVHKFIKGQMPYPPLDFLDRLFRVFGATLIDGLRGSVRPVAQLPILRADVQALADTCAGLSEEGVVPLQHLATTLRDASRKGTGIRLAAPADRGSRRRTPPRRDR